MRIDLIARETHGKYAKLYRVYINYRRFDTIRGITGQGFENSDGMSKKDAELEEKYGIKFLTKETDYYDLVTAIVPDELVEIDEENQVIIIDLEKSRERKTKMANKYKRGRIVRSIADFSTCKADMFWIAQGNYFRHKSWLMSWQYHYLEMMIKRGYIFIAERIEEENSHEHNI